MTARHLAIADGPSLDGTYSWFCQLTVNGNCDGEGFGYPTPTESIAAAVAAGHEVATDDEYPGRYDGIPGLVWYAKVTKTLGRDLKVGDCLDTLDHHGARTIYAIDPGSGYRTVTFSAGGDDSETVRDDVVYDVVDPDSQVAPDGSPL